jgi:cytochrome c biogenesis protein
VNTKKTEPPSPQPALRRLWNSLISMKFGITLLIIIAVVSLLSMFLVEFYPMRPGFSGWEKFYQERYGMGDAVFALFQVFKLYDPYRSWWYQILLGILALSLLACLVDRIPIVLRQAFKPQFRLNPNDLSILSPYYHWNGNYQEPIFLRSLKRHFRIQFQNTDLGKAFYGTRGWLNLFGAIGMHLGLLILVFGGIWISLGGFSESFEGYAGDTVTIPGTHFQLRIDDFRIIYYPLNVGQFVKTSDGRMGQTIAKLPNGRFVVQRMSHPGAVVQDTLPASSLTNEFDLDRDRGNIKDYLCQVTVLENGQAVKDASIEVNHPLRYKKFRFYQSSYDVEHAKIQTSFDSLALKVTRISDQTVLDTLWIKPEEKVTVPQTNQLVSVTDFFPDFRITDQGATTISDEMNNPAVQIQYFSGDSLQSHQWSFLGKEFHQSKIDLPISLQFVDIRNPQSKKLIQTILEIRRTPGTELIWVGFFVATLGLILAFYLGFHRIWVLVLPKAEGQAEIHIALRSHRSNLEWEQRFQHLIEELKNQ